MEPESASAGRPAGTPETGEALADAGVHARVSAGREMPLADVGVTATGGGFGKRTLREDFPDIGVAAKMVQRTVDAPREPGDPLTPREVEVLGLMSGGLSNRELARGLSISPGTVRSHVQNIIAKLEVSDRTGAVVRGIELGLIRITPEQRHP